QNVIRDFDIGTQYLASFFQSVTVRTAGFNSVDFSSLRTPTLMMLIWMMFIGGASGSMAGGVKVNTLGILSVSLFSFLRGRSENVLMHKSISHTLAYKSFFIFFMSELLMILSIIILSCTHSADFITVCFETISAFSTTGASMGMTSNLNVVGKYLIIVLMVLGKIGPMTVLMLLSREETPSNIRYPDVDILIG
ncbi:MAG: potassium transporter, partial [Spirochaetales bacterium]|nr:potassium transporter [Spirochaetales bacterium]